MKYSFPPLINKNAHTLILGTMPGEESLRRQEYYAHPRNQFWRILGEVYQTPVEDNYPARVAFLTSKGLALWDVLESCERKGSLDKDIKNPVFNHLQSFLDHYSNINTLVFNGKKAYEWFKQLAVKPQTELVYLIMPSTSPAAAVALTKKIEQWRKIATL